MRELRHIEAKLLGTRCKVCGTKGTGRYKVSGLDLHHKWYEYGSVDAEGSTPQRRREAIRNPKLFAHLCRTCHNLVHDLAKLSRADQPKAVKLARELKRNWGIPERKRLDKIEVKKIKMVALDQDEMREDDEEMLPGDAIKGVEYDWGCN